MEKQPQLINGTFAKKNCHDLRGREHMDFYGFYTGKEFEAYCFLGHMSVRKERFSGHLHRMHSVYH